MDRLIRIAILSAASLWLVACEQDRASERPAGGNLAERSAGQQPAEEAGGPATTEEQRELRRRALDTQRF